MWASSIRQLFNYDAKYIVELELSYTWDPGEH